MRTRRDRTEPTGGGPLLLGLLLALAACTRLGVVPEEPGPLPSFVPKELVFPPTYLGYPSTLSVEVNNKGDAVMLVLEVPPPFSTGDRLRVERGQKRGLAIWFSPEAPGAWSGELVIRGKDWDHRVPISGEALAPPTCEPSDQCRVSHFDGERCDEMSRDDGSPCDGGPCILGASCRYYGCTGEVDPCPDDGNACTADVCLAESGCAHVDVSDSCPPPSDPCLAAICDPARGCVVTAAKDGTPCGPAHCPESETCLGGSCMPAATCAPEPNWMRMLAVEPMSHTVRAIAPTAGGGLLLTGDSSTQGGRDATAPWLARFDRHGRLTALQHLRADARGPWMEAVPGSDGGAYLLGNQTARLDGSGRIVWRVQIGGDLGVAAADGGLLLAAPYDGPRVTRLDADGAVLWSREYETPARPWISAMARFAGGFAFIASDMWGEEQPWALAIDGDGAPLWQLSLRVPGAQHFALQALVPLGDGLLLAGDTWGEHWEERRAILAHLGPDGALRWSRGLTTRATGYRAVGLVDARGEIVLLAEANDAWGYRLQLVRLDPTGAPIRSHVFDFTAVTQRFDDPPWLQGAAATAEGIAIALGDVGYGTFAAPMILRLDREDRPPPGLPYETVLPEISDLQLDTSGVPVAASEVGTEATPLEPADWEEQEAFAIDPLDGEQRLLVIDPRFGSKVQSIPAGISCPGRCVAAFPKGTRVRLVAESPHYLITGWERSYSPYLNFAEATACATELTLDGDAACSPTVK